MLLTQAAKRVYPFVIDLLALPGNSPAFAQEYGAGLGVTMLFAELDVWRRLGLPAAVAQRPVPLVTGPELCVLMDWKLARGKFRPMLPKLIAANPDDEVQRVTGEALRQYVAAAPDAPLLFEEYWAPVRVALDALCGLRGVGPATATLILSLAGPLLVAASKVRAAELCPPFYSDETYAFFMKAEVNNTPLGLHLKYTMAEYRLVVEAMWQVMEGVLMQDLELAAWCLEVLRTGKVRGKTPVVVGAPPQAVQREWYSSLYPISDEEVERINNGGAKLQGNKRARTPLGSTKRKRR